MISFVIAVLMSLFGSINSSGADIDMPIDHNAVTHSASFVVPDQV
jgi:hypothetical protein